MKRFIMMCCLLSLAACGVQGDLKRPAEMNEEEKQEAWF